MKVILASPRGFCAGVNMAVESLNKALELFGPPVYVFHEIVHNQSVVEQFRSRGAVFVEDIEQVPDQAVVMYSAHGVSPEIRRKSQSARLRAIDATCPLVTKVHNEALAFARKGYQIVLIGHAGHDEVLGTMGEAPESIRLIETVEDVAGLPFEPSTRLAYLTQTTLSVDDTKRIIDALRARYPQIEGPRREDICYATQNRQEVVRRLAPEVDAVLVLGSQNSSNSQRLAEIARLSGRPAYLVDGPEHIQTDWFSGSETVLVTAGASAPERVVQGCLEYLKVHFGATVESITLREEKVHFGLPSALRAIESSARG